MFYTFISPALAAYGNIAVVSAYLYLLAFGNYLAGGIDTGVDYCLAATRASRLYLVDTVGNLEQTTRTLKQISLKVSTQAVAYHVYSGLVDHLRKLIDLLGREELGLVDEHPFRQRLGRDTFFEQESSQVSLGVNP